MARSKAYLFSGIKIRWHCDPAMFYQHKDLPEKTELHFPGGLKDFLTLSLSKEHRVTADVFSGTIGERGTHESLEWAVAWYGGDGFIHSYCNTIPTKEGGTHEAGLRQALIRGLKGYAERIGNKRVSRITIDDVMLSAAVMLSVFIREPEFVGQTKERLTTIEAQRIVETSMRDPFDYWLTNSPQEARKLLDWVIEQADERLRRRQEREIKRRTAVRKLRLPGKLADCTQNTAQGAELFIVEGDSAGGSAKQARNRATQAILPLRGKILNVASASHDKLSGNQQLADIIQALGCETRAKYREDALRYERVIIMTDADVDGAHIASLLLTFFYQEMPDLIYNGHLYLAVPPLYRISQGGRLAYARNDAHKDALLKTQFTGHGKIEIGRFKGLGEMRAEQLKETTMAPDQRTLLQITIDDTSISETGKMMNNLMGSKPNARFRFIQEHAASIADLDI